MSPSSSTAINSNASVSPAENGFIASFSLLNSEKAVQEVIQQPLLEGVDDHLREFSETLRTVAKALRRVTEGKASAQAEAAEWKRKYELEKELLSSEGHCSELNVERARESKIQTDENSEQCELCSGKDDICAHEILRDSEPDSDCAVVQNKMPKKASFKLSWHDKGEKSDRHKHDIVSFEKGDITAAERSSKQISLKWESPPQTVLILSKPNSTSVRILCFEMVRWLKEHKSLNIIVEPRVRAELLTESSYYSFVQTWLDDKDILLLHTKVDLIVTLGGDGTVLWCHIIRDAAKSEYENEGPMLVLNEVTIDRGISSFLTNLECYCDNSFVTCVQGDGLILSTTSGSTAYSLAAGGSMVHPQVPGVLFTPICPHSLSFRPLILPEHVTLRIVVPFNSRSHAWVSFDGKGRKQLAPGDALVCSMAPWPVPTACQLDSTSDFLRSIHDGLHWNLRKTQSFDGPHDP
ncbi:hypothetical protein BUALT_Bualt13G0040200 [Buddleja alternifolia]|uniref:NAD(+) kinase n=1 Tax=Buddleja alternifolia TaxID=168488 RepID=A0AAV6WKA8_9LAMI|nr:hypothetical protein BUALT_Bualt13G0040200 [Buddleja alternifolia]